jgi:hypothetical protein
MLRENSTPLNILVHILTIMTGFLSGGVPTAATEKDDGQETS